MNLPLAIIMPLHDCSIRAYHGAACTFWLKHTAFVYDTIGMGTSSVCKKAGKNKNTDAPVGQSVLYMRSFRCVTVYRMLAKAGKHCA